VIYHVAHATRGRLRVRYPVSWLRRRRGVVETRLRGVRGVRSVLASSVTGSIVVDYDPFALAEVRLLGHLQQLHASLDRAPARVAARAPRPADAGVLPPLLQLLASGAVLATAWLPVPGPMLAALVLASDAPALARAAAALSRGRVDGNVLEAAALLLLVARRQYVAGALLSGLRSLGEVIVAKSVVTTRRSLYQLVADPDQKVTRLEGARRRKTAVGKLRPGDVVAVRAETRLPMDGTIVAGEALVNQQTMTGEAMPVERRAGDRVFAATTVDHGEIHVRVDHLGLETAVGRIVQAVEAAAGEKSDIQKLAERLADRDVGRTLVLAGLGAAFARSLDAATAIMVADYGLAARVGIPTAILTSIKRASRAGILIKGPAALENLARVNTVVFDKTGTLTSGTPRVTRVIAYRRDVSEREIIRLTAVAERGFGHPVARAVARLARQHGLDPSGTAVAAEAVGLGVDVAVEGARVLVGSRRFMQSRSVDLGAAARDEAAAHAVGAAPTFVAVDGRLAGMLVLEDELRPEAPDAVLALRARRMRNVIMLSGDHPEPSRVIADMLGLKHHHADLLPEDKARLIRELRAEGRVVAMVGDGVNDALALREADVGIAVPGGAAVAVEVADVVLLHGGLDQVAHALDLSTDAVAGIRRTLDVASRANLGVVGLASFGLARPVTSILLSHGSTVAAAIAIAAGTSWRPAWLSSR
jgi:heavy metal translocating P-type ATPase